FFFSSTRRHTSFSRDWSSDVCSSDLGLVMAEMTNVSAEGRISPGCTGLYRDEHVAAWRRITGFVHDHSQAKIGIQLGHAGRKARSEERRAGKECESQSTSAPCRQRST